MEDLFLIFCAWSWDKDIPSCCREKRVPSPPLCSFAKQWFIFMSINSTECCCRFSCLVMTLKMAAQAPCAEPGPQPAGSHIVLLCVYAVGVCSITSLNRLAHPGFELQLVAYLCDLLVSPVWQKTEEGRKVKALCCNRGRASKQSSSDISLCVCTAWRKVRIAQNWGLVNLFTKNQIVSQWAMFQQVLARFLWKVFDWRLDFS